MRSIPAIMVSLFHHSYCVDDLIIQYYGIMIGHDINGIDLASCFCVIIVLWRRISVSMNTAGTQ